MRRHIFLVNVHDDVDQALRLCRILRRHYADSAVAVWLDGPEPVPSSELSSAAGAESLVGNYEPDKCRGILTALNGLVEHATANGFGLASLLHPDMVPTDGAQFRHFLERFSGSGKALTFSPMLPAHPAPSFCNLHFNLGLAKRLFPIRLEQKGDPKRWYNEGQAYLSWEKSWPGWQGHAYPMGLLTLPHTNQFFCDDKPVEKVVHGPGWQFAFNDYCPESSVVHTNAPAFWEGYETYARF